MNAPRWTEWRKSSYSAENGVCVEIAWRKSSHSAGSGACVEVAWHKSSHSAENGHCVEVGWQKSSHSAGNGHCVEVAPVLGAVRDSKNPDGPVVHGDLVALVTRVKGGHLLPRSQ